MEAIILRYKATEQKNRLGQIIYDYAKSETLTGWLDMLSGTEADRAQALQSSTHVYITKQTDIKLTMSDRLSIDGQVYEVTYVDNPVNLGHHLEIYLKVAG